MSMFCHDGRLVSVLSIAGSDSGGNAGLQADVRAFHFFGLHACMAVASVTAQNPSGVSAVKGIPASVLDAQLRAVLPPVYGIAAIKTGMLATAAAVKTVAARLRALSSRLPIVVDPVMVATSGARLIAPNAVAAMRDILLPLAAVATPNVPEAEVLAGFPIRTAQEMEKAARVLSERAGGKALLVKGGHRSGAEAQDVLVSAEGVRWFSAPVISNPASTHGTGCSLSAAIAACLARGESLVDAVRHAKAFVWESIRSSLPVGDEATVLGTPERLPDVVDVRRGS